MMYGYGYGYGYSPGMSFMMFFGIFYLIVVATFLYFIYDIGKSLRRIAVLLEKNRPE